MLWCWETKMNESSLEETERSRQRRKGKSHVAAKLQSDLFFLEETTEWNIRWYQIRVLTGAAVALLLVVFVRDGVRRTGVSSPDLLFGQWVITQIRLISWRTERKTQKKLDESDPVATEVSDIKPQDHRNMQHNAWKTYAEERVKYKLLSLNSTVRNTSPINEQTDSRAKSF